MSELPSHGDNSPRNNLSDFREAAVVFEPTEQLNELLTSFRNPSAQERLGDKVVELTLLHAPYRYNESDAKANAVVAAYQRKIQTATPRNLRISHEWDYWSDKVDDKPPKHLFIAMQVGGTALASTIAEPPFYRANYPLVVYAKLPKRDVLPGSLLEAQRQTVARALHDHPGRDGMYASPHYQIGRPRLSERPLIPLRLVKQQGRD